MTRSTITLSAIWLGLCLALVLAFTLPDDIFPLDECSSFPKDQLANCRHQQKYGFPQPIYNHPYLRGYPNNMIDKDGNWSASIDDALTGPQRIHLPYMNLSIMLRAEERAFANENAKWMKGKLLVRCTTGYPDAVLFSRGNDRTITVTTYNLYKSLPNARHPDEWPKNYVIDIPEDLAATQAALKRFFRHTTNDSHAAWWHSANNMRRFEMSFLEEPRSLTQETGVQRIMTYAFRVKWFNRSTEELEITATFRDILLPYNDGTILIRALKTTLDGAQSPRPSSWQELWRDIKFSDEETDNRPAILEDGSVEERIEAYTLLYRIMRCEDIDALPEPWAWPKGYPRHWWSLR